jgi:arabinofuranosyltransferase
MPVPSPLPRLLAAFLLVVFLAVLIRTAWISDDALITLRTVLNVTHGFGLTFNVAERVQTFTHPLWLFLLTATYLIVGNVYLATFALSIGVSLIVFWMALTRAATAAQAWLAASILLFSRAFVDFSTSGLENPLANLLIAAFAGVFVAGLDRGRWLTALWAIASLLYLTRPDAVLFVAPLLLWASYRVRTPAILVRAIGVGLLPAAAWTVFSVLYYGFPFPNTAYAKLATGISRGELWSQGALYLIDSIDRDPLTLTVVVFAIVAGFSQASAAARGFAAGLVLYLLYVMSVGGDFMAGRFVAVPAFAAVIVLSRLIEGPKAVWYVAALAAVIVGAASAQVPLLSDSRFDATAVKPSGIVDERAVYFRNQSLVLATRRTFTEPDWPSKGRRPARSQVLETCGLMGSAGLSWGPYTHLLDDCALADPLLARLPAMFNVEWRAGHYRRLIPDGYRESLESSANVIEDPALRDFYDRLRLVVRSPDLFSAARLREIVRMNLGGLAPGVNWAYYRYGGSVVGLDRVADVKPDGTGWDAEGNHILNRPLAVTCEARRGRRYMDLTVDSDDRYRLYFIRRRAIVGSIEIDPVPPHRRTPGLVSHTFDVPSRAVDQGFDTILVVPIAGDDRYALGHLLVEGFPRTDAELHRRVAIRDGTGVR